MTAAVDSSSNVVISQVRSLYICGGYVAGSEAWHTVFEVAIYRHWQTHRVVSPHAPPRAPPPPDRVRVIATKHYSNVVAE